MKKLYHSAKSRLWNEPRRLIRLARIQLKSRSLERQLERVDMMAREMAIVASHLRDTLTLFEMLGPADHSQCAGLSSWGSLCRCQTAQGRRELEVVEGAIQLVKQIMATYAIHESELILKEIEKLDMPDDLRDLLAA